MMDLFQMAGSLRTPLLFIARLRARGETAS
jgi:hypothetical protein